MRLTHETVWTDHTTDTNRPQEPCLHRNKISNKENNGFVKLETAEKNLLQDNRTYYKTTEPITRQQNLLQDNRTYYKTTEPITTRIPDMSAGSLELLQTSAIRHYLTHVALETHLRFRSISFWLL